MKILKIFGAVLAVHGLAFLFILAIPGCSSSNPEATPPPATASDVPTGTNSVPAGTNAVSDESTPTVVTDTTILPNFNPNAEAVPERERYRPTRPQASPIVPVSPSSGSSPVEAAAVTPASTYTVVRGDSLWSISRRNNVTVAELTAANHLSANAPIVPGQKLIIPAAAEPETSGPSGPTYTVKPNDTLSGIARRSGTTTTALRELNHLTSDMVRVGQELSLPEGTTVAPAAASTATTDNAYTHVVKPGETLDGIARRYQTTVGEIAAANNISNPALIRAGAKLVIPGWQAPQSNPAPAAAPAATPAPAPSAPPPAPPESDTGTQPPSDGAPVINVDTPVIPVQ